ncbi:2-succinyl-5-enolpyruvyl-6-hydroxy-3-cyclohexene-1-carboxylic-acid synthase [Spirosoma lituiforme]
MSVLQPIVNLAELLYRKGITDVVISPGSRSAPLTLAVARHPHLKTRVMADERSACFVALGMALQTRRPVAVICTSGSAVYNLAPAVVEAFFGQVPLLLLTADRPHEWLHQQDGQTMNQVGVFGSHVKRSYDLPADYTHPDARWFVERSVNEAINLSQLHPPGPVHINVPLREPFYPGPDEPFVSEPVRVIDTCPAQLTLSADTWRDLMTAWEQSERTLIAIGQIPYDPALLAVLRKLSDEMGIPVVGEIVSNMARNERFITRSDTILSGLSEQTGHALQPALLLTMGNSFLTRNLKTFLRRFPAYRHWHIQPTVDRINDSLQSLTTLIPADPLSFLEKLYADLDYQRFLQGDEDEETRAYLQHWQTLDRQASRLINQTLSTAGQLTDWSAVQVTLEHLPPQSLLHLANSMPVRYANLCGLNEAQQIPVSANRGVSGIDGCLSTAVGAALMTDQLVTILIGDVSFFYDRNALWSAPVPPNLRIVLLNNDSGHIFRIIDGPARQPELETFFETPHGYTAKNTADDANLVYTHCDSLETLTALLPDFFQSGTTARLLEITTDKRANQEQFMAYKTQIQKAGAIQIN